jgi:peroxiredoxin
MRKYLKGLLFVFWALTFVSGVCLVDRASAEGQTMKEPVLASDFKLQDIRQDIVTLTSYRGKQPVLLFFWTTWCPVCQRELTVLNNTYQNLVEDGIELLAIDIGELPDTVNNFIQSLNLAYRVLLDKDTSISASFGLIGVPTYVLIDKAGYIVFKDNYFPQKEYKNLVSK